LCNTLRYIKEKLTSLRIPGKQYEALERIAKRDDRSIAWLIRKAIEEFVKREQS
jgi:predicted transcriptional regulator